MDTWAEVKPESIAVGLMGQLGSVFGEEREGEV